MLSFYYYHYYYYYYLKGGDGADPTVPKSHREACLPRALPTPDSYDRHGTKLPHQAAKDYDGIRRWPQFWRDECMVKHTVNVQKCLTKFSCQKSINLHTSFWAENNVFYGVRCAYRDARPRHSVINTKAISTERRGGRRRKRRRRGQGEEEEGEEERK